MNDRLMQLRPMFLLAAVLLLFGALTNLACDEQTTLPSEPEAASQSPVDSRVAAPEAPETNLGEVALEPAAGKGQPKQDICHVKGNGDFIIINVAAPAVPAHLAHGDHLPLTFYADNDGDGFGAGDASTGCVVPDGFVENDDDCDDASDVTFPGAAEKDSPTACMKDADDDGWGDDSPSGSVTPGTDCNDNDASLNQDDSDGDGFSTCDGDCNDANSDINPGEAETCNGIDDNCNNDIDEGLTFDLDFDLFTTPDSCEGTKDDCDDGDAAINPGATEVCDSVDNNCDGNIDEGDVCGAPPVAVNDDFILTSVECVVATCPGGPGLDRTCVLNAPAGTITANDSDPDSPFDAFIDGPITDPGWTCNGDNLCTTDANFNGGASSLTVNTDGSFDLVYTTSQNFIFGGPADVVIAEFLYFLEDPGGNLSNIARVMVPVHCP